MSDKHHVAAGDAATARAAQIVLESGGNAYDGAVAAMFTAMVAEPTLTSAGGGGHLMACPAEDRPVLFDFFVDMPGGQLQEENFFPVEVDFGTATQEFHIGTGSAAVPGNIAGLLHVQKHMGRMSCREVLTPAIEAARHGVTITECQAAIVHILAPIFTHDPQAEALLSPNGQLLRGGDQIRMPVLANFLEALANEGANLFYKGMAQKVEEWSDGHIRAEDMEQYKVHEREPLKTQFAGHTVLLNPPPAASGLLMDFTFSLLNECPHVGPNEFARAFSLTNDVRQRYFCNAPDGKNPFILKSSMDEYQTAFRNGSVATVKPESTSRGATTHISVLDREGNAASVTTTNGESCGFMLPDAGFMLNNMLGEEDLNPNGFHTHEPGTRLPSMMAPSVALRDGRPALVTGSGGSNRIRSALVQIIARYLSNGEKLEDATSAPRIHLEGNTLHAEPGLNPKELAGPWEVKYWDEQNVYFGGAHSVASGEATGDARRGGSAIIF